MGQQLEILVLSGVSAGDVFRFTMEDGKSITIGRAEQCNVVLSDPRVSRHHVSVSYKQDQFQIADLGSASGTVHMGFQLTPGDEGARRLNNGDEFKIGDLLFRAKFEESEKAKAVASSEASTKPAAGSGLVEKYPILKKKPIVAALGLLTVLLLALLLMPGKSGPKLPKQKSNIALELPEYRLLGYWPGGKKTPKANKDSSHLDMVQFNLPASNLLIEYDYIGEADIKVSIDGAEIERLAAYSEGWRKRQIVVRDVLEGKARRLVFDNLGYPRKKGEKGRIKRWGVKNVRATPLVREIGDTAEKQLARSIALSDGVDKTPEGLSQLIRSMQRTILEFLYELNIDQISVPIIMSSIASDDEVLDVSDTSNTLETVRLERSNSIDDETGRLHLEAIVSAVGRLEAELWRRVNSRFRQATFSAKAKNHIVVYDNLVSIKAMFPDETDYRWVRANKLLKNKKYVPKKLLEDPNRYRR